MSEGLIYFAKYVGDLSYVKIAYTENLYKSIRNLSNKRSTPVEVLFVIRDCCIEDEDRIHIRLGFGAHYKEDWYLWPKVQEFISNEIKKVLVPEIPKEIKELHFKSDLVILAACETALSKSFRLEGSDGLKEAFIIAGTKGIIATLWKVEDDTAYEVTSYLHQQVAYDRNIVKALSEIKRKFIYHKDKRKHHPAFWAAYQYYGLST